MAFPQFINASTGFLTGGSTSGAITLGFTPTKKNLLVFCMAGDKNIGTLTVDSGNYQLPIDLRSTSLSLSMGLKESNGTETTVPVTITSGNPGGSQMWVGEMAEPDNPNIWTFRGGATNNTDESNQTVWSTGTSSVTTGDGLAVAFWGVDSVMTVGAFTYSNGFTGQQSPSSGGAEAGLWIAKLNAPRGATYESTLDRVGSSADQMSGALLVLGRAPVTPTPFVGSYNSVF